MKRPARGILGELDADVSLVRLVVHAHHGVVAVRTTEAVFLGLAALAVTLAAAVLGGGELARFAPWVVASGAATLAGLTWAFAHRVTPDVTARRLDERLGLAGALLTAFEATRRAGAAAAEEREPRAYDERRSAVVRLLAARVAARVSRAEALRRALPSSGLAIASPFVGAVLLALAIEAVAPEPRAPGLAALTGELTERLASARGSSLGALESGRKDELGPGGVAVPLELSELLAEAGRLDSAWRGGELAPAEALERVKELEQALDAVARRLAPDGDVARTLARAGTLLDAARMQLTRASADSARPPTAAAERGDSRSRDRAVPPAGSGDAALAPRPTDGRMSGPRSSDAGVAAAAPAELGAVSRRWPPEYDDVVARWTEWLETRDENPHR